ncbi:uncharacterized protein LOC141876081 [Acropora palmata]|uniref:uncharacterized protein LOC141876081 n=1 Tax=Acropora palmata TaxID=6131 RepID=UPI003DA087ED
MRQERLNAVLLPFVHKDIALDYAAAIVDDYAKRNQRRITFVNPLQCFRPVGFGELKLVELHSFADASQVAYGTVCYLRLVDVNDRMHCAFLDGRSRLANVRPMTMPRLELCAAVLAFHLKQSIKEELDIPVTKSTFWSDSTCVLQYIKSQSRRFRTLSNFYEWLHLPSELNPADEVSRGVSATKSLGLGISQMVKTKCQMTTQK